MGRVKALAAPPVDRAPIASIHQVSALKALSTGKASEHQQNLAWEFILRRACAVQAQSFRSDPQQTAFMEGRRFAGSVLLTLASIDVSTMKDDT